MIKRWEIRENTITDGSIYLLAVIAGKEDIAILQNALPGFLTEVSAQEPPFTNFFELANITDDGVLERVRVKIEAAVKESENTAPPISKDAKEPLIDLNANTLAGGYAFDDEQKISAEHAVSAEPQKTIDDAPDGSSVSLNIVDDETRVHVPRQRGINRATSKVNLADGDISFKREFEGLNSELNLSNGLDVGDGTLIDLDNERGQKVRDITVTSFQNNNINANNVSLAPLGESAATHSAETVSNAKEDTAVESPTKTTADTSILNNIFNKFEQGESIVSNIDTTQNVKKTELQEKPKEKVKKLSPFAKLKQKISNISARKTKKLSDDTFKPLATKTAQTQNVEPVNIQISTESKMIANSPRQAPFKFYAQKQEIENIEKSVLKIEKAQIVEPEDKKNPLKEVSLQDGVNGMLTPAHDGDDLLAKMPVDDIFAAETIVDFYAGDYSNSAKQQDMNATVLDSKENPFTALSSKPITPQNKQTSFKDDFLDVPENIFSSTPAATKSATPEIEAIVEPAAPASEMEKEPAGELVAEAAVEPTIKEPVVEPDEQPIAEPILESAQEQTAPSEDTEIADIFKTKIEELPEIEIEEVPSFQPKKEEAPVVSSKTELADIFETKVEELPEVETSLQTEPNEESVAPKEVPFQEVEAPKEAVAQMSDPKVETPNTPEPKTEPKAEIVEPKAEEAEIIDTKTQASAEPEPKTEDTPEEEDSNITQELSKEENIEESQKEETSKIEEAKEEISKKEEDKNEAKNKENTVIESTAFMQDTKTHTKTLPDGVIDLKKQKNKNITQVEATLEPQKQMSIFDASQDFSKGDLLLQEISDSDFAPLPAKPAAPKINKIRSKQLGENKNKMTEEKNNIEQIQTINQNIDIKQAEPKPSAPKPSMPKPSAPKVAAPKPPLPKAASKPVPPAVAKPATLTSVKKPALPVAPIAATTLKDSSKKCELDRTTTIDHTIQVPAGQIYKRSNWPLEIPLIPTFTFENMDMSSNRFVHATAISVMENLGNIYNPFVIFGDGGSGKTHFLNAMGYELSKKIPQDKIYITNGVRFSRGIQRYVEEGRIAKLEEFFNNSQVLIIDDIHLTAVNEHNREVISKVLNTFLKEKKQIIISSKYPPESLARFEELVNFRLDHGWVGEIKSPRPQHFTRIYNKMVRDADLGISDTQAQVFFGRDGFNLGTIARSIRRAKVLRRRMEDSGSAILSYEDILNEMLAVNGENEDSEIIKKNFGDITALRRGENTDWGTFGFFFPQDQADKFKWIVYATMQRAKELGIKGGFNFALKSAYSTENIISSAFKIANICDNKNLKGAIILGPSVTSCAPAIRENFYDILSHMLEVMMIRCGIVDAEFIKTPSAYVKVLGDVLK